MCNVQVEPELWSKGPEPHLGRAAQSQECSFPSGAVPGPSHRHPAPLPGVAGGCAELERSGNYWWGLDAVGVLLLKSSLIEREKLP